MVLDGRLSMGHARELSKLEDREQILKYANEIVNKNLSVRDVEALSKGTDVKKKNPINRDKKDNKYHYIEKELREVLGTKVKINNKKMEISFENVNDLSRILEIMNIKIDWFYKG